VALLPPCHAYVEVFGGSGAVLLNKPLSPVEVFNDIDSELVNLFMTVRDHPAEFIRHVESLPYARTLRDAWRTQFYRGRWPKDRFERAVRYYYLVRSSFFGHIDKGWRFALKTDEAARLYNCIGEVEQIAQRLAHVHIDHKDFRRCIHSYDRPNTVFYCITGSTRIRMENETLPPICRVKVGHSSINGRVRAVHKRRYRGRLMKIWVSGLLEPVELTPDHPVLAVRKREVWYKRQPKPARPDERDLQWIRADELEEGDYVAIRCFGATIFKKSSIPLLLTPRKHGRLDGYRDSVDWSRSLFRFFGYYLAEGHLQRGRTGRPISIVFSFARKERRLHAEVAELSFELFGKKALIRQGTPVPSVTQVWLGARPVAELLNEHCGCGARTKRCSNEIMTSDPHLQLELLKTWLLGDGGFERSTKNRNRVRGTTASYVLAHQMFQIALRNGLVTSHRRRGHGYDLVISNNRDLRRLGYRTFQQRPTCVSRPIVGDYILSPIRKIEDREFSGLVWNLTTQTHHLNTNYVETHNCDPPYYGTVPYRKGIPPFTERSHMELASLLRGIQGKFLLTYNDHPSIRKLYTGFKISEVVTRLNTDKTATANRRPFRQLIIRNYET